MYVSDDLGWICPSLSFEERLKYRTDTSMDWLFMVPWQQLCDFRGDVRARPIVPRILPSFQAFLKAFPLVPRFLEKPLGLLSESSD